MRSKALTVFVIVASIVFAGSFAQAAMYRVAFDARTQKNYDSTGQTVVKQMSFWIEVFDTSNKNPPQFIKSITIKAPDGTTFPITTKDHWRPFDRGYGANIPEAGFAGGVIPAGTYTAVVVDVNDSKISATDVIADPVSFVSPAKITAPAAGATGVIEQCTIKWDAVTGAKRYGISLWDTTANEPVFSTYNVCENLYTNFTSFKIPKGYLKPNHNYRVQIQARSDLQDTDKRSFSKWVYFTTGSW